MAPEEGDYVRYFFMLKNVRNRKSSSIWTYYSRLNYIHQNKYGRKLQDWPRLTHQLRNYMKGYERNSATAFSREEMELAIQVDNDTPQWVLYKAVVCVAFVGGLRGIELRSITFGNVKEDHQGIWVEFYQAKRRGEEQRNGFVIPFNRSHPHLCWATRVVNYRAKLVESFPSIKPEDAFFRRALKDRFSQHEVLGKSAFGRIGKEIAQHLNLRDASSYTGHTFRRSAATEAANNGATSTDLKTGLGWENEKTGVQFNRHFRKPPKPFPKYIEMSQHIVPQYKSCPKICP